LQNAVECEMMKIFAKSGDSSAAPQPLDRLGGYRWSGANHLFVRAGKIGDFVELRFPVEGDGPRKLILHGTQSYDYGVLRLRVISHEKDWNMVAPAMAQAIADERQRRHSIRKPTGKRRKKDK